MLFAAATWWRICSWLGPWRPWMHQGQVQWFLTIFPWKLPSLGVNTPGKPKLSWVGDVGYININIHHSIIFNIHIHPISISIYHPYIYIYVIYPMIFPAPGQIPGQIPENLHRLQEGPLQLLTRDVLRIVDAWRAQRCAMAGVSWFSGRCLEVEILVPVKWPRKLMKIALMSARSMLEVIPMFIARENQTPHAKLIHGMWHVMSGPSPSSIWILGRRGHGTKQVNLYDMYDMLHLRI